MPSDPIVIRLLRGAWTHKRLLTFLFAVLAVLPLFAHAWFQRVEFNQFLIHRADLKYGSSTMESVADYAISSYSSGLNILCSWPDRTPPEYSDPDRMFHYVFSWLPSHARAYPTEGYYYFSFPHPAKGLVCGSLRLADLDRGMLTFSYFRMLDDDGDQEVHIHRVGDITVKKHGDYRYDVTHGARNVSFDLLDTSFLERLPDSVTLLPDEEFVTRMFDESGLRFVVLFNRATQSFYYVLDQEDGVADALVEVGNEGFERGERTGFVFYCDRDLNRRLLVGVSFRSVKRNDFLDGPGDQVPFRLRVRDRLNLAYPSTLLGHGLDVHGVMLGRKHWSRFLISAYHQYADLDGMLEYTAPALEAGYQDKSDLWTALTKEWWHTRKWRTDQYAKLAKEGKVVTPFIERASRRTSRDQQPRKRISHVENRP